MARSVLEGVAYGLKDIFNLIAESGGGKEIKQVRASGGGVKSQLWMQILASVLENELVTVNSTEGAAFGAALLAGVGAGAWSDVRSACREVVEITGRTAPREVEIKTYRDGYEIYQDLYPALKSIFPRM